MPDHRLPYLPALDGLRAVAVMAVVLYHSGWRWAVGGHLGVEVFFVISGYLITSLLYREWQSRGRIGVGAFWLGRARRLLPALALLLLSALAYAVFVLPTEVTRLRSAALAAAAYASNWYMILHQQSYFEMVGRPSLLRHLWSLAVEEQYYLLWPVVFWGLMRLGRRRLTVAAAALATVASVAYMALLHQPGADPSRVYYGTDTRAAGLLVGSILALLSSPAPRQGSAGTRRCLLLDGAGCVSLAALLSCLVLLDGESPVLYRGGFAMVSLLTAATIALAVHPDAKLLPALLGWRPLRWLASRSYGVYLWHWPVFVVTRPYVDVPVDGVPLLLLRLVVTAVCAEASYRLVEMPVRSGSVGRSWRHAVAASGARGMPLRLGWAGAAASLSVALALLGASVGSAQPPAPPSYLRVEHIDTLSRSGVQAAGTIGVAAVATAAAPPGDEPDAREAGGLSLAGHVSGATWVAPAATATPAAPLLAVPAESPTSVTPAEDTPALADAVAGHDAVAPVVPVVADAAPPRSERLAAATGPGEAAVTSVSAIGDSVMIGAAAALEEEIPVIGIDAAASRQAAAMIDVLTSRRDADELGSVVILHIGNNGSFTSEQFDEVMDVLGESRRVVFVNAKVPREWEGTNNTVIAEGVERHDNAVLADWHQSGIDHPEYFWDDGIHLRPEGAKAYARLIADTVAMAPEPVAGLAVSVQ